MRQWFRTLIITLLLCSSLVANATPQHKNYPTKYVPEHNQVIAAYIHQVNPKLHPKVIHQLLLAIDRNHKQYGLPINLQLGLINVESGFDQYAHGPTDDYGFWQVVPKYHEKMIKRMLREGIIKNRNMYDVNTNTAIGGKVLYDCMRANNWIIKSALLCYNGSVFDTKAKYANKVLNQVHSVAVARHATN